MEDADRISNCDNYDQINDPLSCKSTNDNSRDSDSEDEVPLLSLLWREKDFVTHLSQFIENEGPKNVEGCDDLYDFYKVFFDDTFFDNLAFQTNLSVFKKVKDLSRSRHRNESIYCYQLSYGYKVLPDLGFLLSHLRLRNLYREEI